MAVTAGIVLAGGRSSRMGKPKAALEWHGTTLLHRTVSILARATAGPVIVVRAPGQELPGLPPGTLVVEDPCEGNGPVQGIAAGLAALSGVAEVAFISATDMPFLHPAFIRRVLSGLASDESASDNADSGRAASNRGDGPPGSVDVCLPVARGYPQPLAAAYRVALAGTAERLVRNGRLRPVFLFEECVVRRLDDATLAADPSIGALDPGLDSVVNVNEPADYAAARARPAPPVTVRLAGALARPPAATGPGKAGSLLVRAATVAEAAAAATVPLGPDVTAALNGGQVIHDPLASLAAGDTVLFTVS